jgi:protein TonB
MIEARARSDRPALADVHKLLICAVISLVAHAVFARVLELLPAQPIAAAPRKIEVRVVERKPEPPPELPAVREPARVPAPPVPPPPTPAPPRPRAPTPHAAPSPPPAPTPPSEPKPAPPTPANDEPVFDVSMSSTSTAGNGPQVGAGGGVRGGTGSGGAGNATAPASGDRGRQTSEPVPDYAVTTLPVPQGRCFGQYTDDARKAGVEGTVVLDLVIGEDGRVRDVDVTSRLGHGLDQAAVAALRACRFTPGEKDGQRVAVRVRGFKVRFALSDAQ